MIIKTNSGLRGELIEFTSTAIDHSRDGLDGFAIIRRQDATFRDLPYSTHLLYTDPDGNQYAQSGRYDMTLDQARVDLAKRSSRSLTALSKAWRQGLAAASFEDGEIFASSENPYL